MPSSEEVQKALQVIQDYKSTLQRGDSFDIGTEDPAAVGIHAVDSPIAVNNVLNPSQIKNTLKVSEQQAENIRSLVVGAGASISYKMLRKNFGDEFAAAIGAAGSAWLVKKFLK